MTLNGPIMLNNSSHEMIKTMCHQRKKERNNLSHVQCLFIYCASDIIIRTVEVWWFSVTHCLGHFKKQKWIGYYYIQCFVWLERHRIHSMGNCSGRREVFIYARMKGEIRVLLRLEFHPSSIMLNTISRFDNLLSSGTDIRWDDQGWVSKEGFSNDFAWPQMKYFIGWDS